MIYVNDGKFSSNSCPGYNVRIVEDDNQTHGILLYDSYGSIEEFITDVNEAEVSLDVKAMFFNDSDKNVRFNSHSYPYAIVEGKIILRSQTNDKD